MFLFLPFLLPSGCTVFSTAQPFAANEPLVGSKRIVYSSYPGERAIIEGGQVLTGWASTKNGVWSAPLPLSMRGFVPRQAWIGEDRVNETGLVGTNMTFGDGTVLNKSNTVMTNHYTARSIALTGD